MRATFQSSKTTVSMQKADITARGEVIGSEWQVIYAKGGQSHVHMAFATEDEADACMDLIKANAEAAQRLLEE